MATVLLSAAGSAIGNAVGGTVLGVGAASIGQAVGAIAGGLIDQTLLGAGSAPVEVGRARGLRLQTSSEGAAVARVFGRMRVAGQLIWSTRFAEQVRSTTQGSKATGGGQVVREFSYTISFAVGLCEGVIERVGRIWADGKLMATAGVTYRVYRGDEAQVADPKIEAAEGAAEAPAYRGLAYVVFEDLDLAEFGNRIPQLNFEVFRSPARIAYPKNPAEQGVPVRELVRGVAMSPGTGEFALDPDPVQYLVPGGPKKYANVNTSARKSDLKVALDQLAEELPDCGAVSLVVSWFGTDLRCGRCRVEPRVEKLGRQATPQAWRASGLTTTTAALVSVDAEGRVNFGGAPSDASIIKAIREMTARGLKVMIYPFLLMDIPGGNDLGNPYGGVGQPAFPWRGRITLDVGPGRAGSSDGTQAAAAEVAGFFGAAEVGDFAVRADGVDYAGPEDFGWRRFVLHLAHLAQAAGGVEAFCVGSEFRGLTTIRSGPLAFPAVEQFRALAADVRGVLPGTKIGYAADWSEYFGYHPAGGDVLFHLDPLWADPNIDFVGIDDYTPLSDWRYDQAGDGDARSVYSLEYLSGNVEGGEYYDYFYADEAARAARDRQPIADTGHGEDWVYRPKDIRGWWSNRHHNRVGGVRSAAPTAWVPQSKPVWLTETGCPAVDLGANQPNLFVDERSSEHGLPVGSAGARDDEMQRRFLQAKLAYWGTGGRNPVSAVYQGPMIPPGRMFVWTWDARPWPDFPLRESVWADGPNHRFGHWISGRVNASALAEVVLEICVAAGLARVDVSGLYGAVDGYVIDSLASAREALQPLMMVHGFDAVEIGGEVRFQMRDTFTPVAVLREELVAGGEAPDFALAQTSAGALIETTRLGFIDAEVEYGLASAEAKVPFARPAKTAETSLNLALSGSVAQGAVERWLSEAEVGRDTLELTLPPSRAFHEPGDVIACALGGEARTYRITRVYEGGTKRVEAVRIDPGLYGAKRRAERRREGEIAVLGGPVEVHLLDLPLADGGAADHQPRVVAVADPWPGEVALVAYDADGPLRTVATLRRPGVVATLLDDLAPGAVGRWQQVAVRVACPTGGLVSETRAAVQAGRNMLVAMGPGGVELIGFERAELVAPDVYVVRNLLRGLRGTGVAPLAAGVTLVRLDEAVGVVDLGPGEVRRPVSLRVHVRGDEEAAPVVLERTFAARGLAPFAPVALRVARVGGDIAIGWIRTGRIGADEWEQAEVPLGEEREQYRVTLLAGAVSLREIVVGEPRATYTAAQQAADGGAADGVRVAQFSASFGYGAEAVAVV